MDNSQNKIFVKFSFHILPAADFLKSFDNAVKMRSFLRIIVPAVHHQLNVFRLHFRARNVGTEWRIFMRDDTLNDNCFKDDVKVLVILTLKSI